MSITCKIKEPPLSKNATSYESVMNEINTIEQKMDCFVAMNLDYKTNYTLKELEMIGGYYSIKRRRMRKDEFIKELVDFENNLENEDIVHRRKLMWSYLDELLEDNYLRKFIVLK